MANQPLSFRVPEGMQERIDRMRDQLNKRTGGEVWTTADVCRQSLKRGLDSLQADLLEERSDG